MKLSIDTQADSKDDLRKAIDLLRSIVGEDIKTTNLEQSPLPSTDVAGLMSLFDNPPAQPVEQPDQTDLSAIPKIEFY
ncbi:hypothetical protein HY489_00750 [Candidatus Woesearchaeota archaeon]|nr:hypothetical protein [Candidatus Woesearchaeota archaeon]